MLLGDSITIYPCLVQLTSVINSLANFLCLIDRVVVVYLVGLHSPIRSTPTYIKLPVSSLTAHESGH